jgi:flagellar biosynthesis chaperone FliJ
MKAMTKKVAVGRAILPALPGGWRGAGTCHASSVLLLLPLVALTGCKGRALEQARQETKAAQATILQLKHNLNQAADEMAKMKAELGVVRQNRDELQEQVVQLIEKQDQASQQARATIADLTARTSGQVNAAAALQQQIAQLKNQVAEQQKTIEQLQKALQAAPPITEPPATEPPTEETGQEKPPTEPNEGT